MKKSNYNTLKTILMLLLIGIITYSFMYKDASGGDQYAAIVNYDRPDYLNFPTDLSPETPWDIDRTLQQKLMSEGKFEQTQRLFEILSWQWFISLNWPKDENGKPAKNIAGRGVPEWFGWKESYEVFLPNGQRPAPWGVFTPPSGFDGSADSKILFRTNKFADFAHPDIEDETKQAFTSPIWDQNGNITRYEVRMNRKEFEYILNNELYNFDGQIAFANENGNVDFPEGNWEDEGVIEIKVAWKVLEDSDIKSRYFTTDGYVINPDGSYTQREVGMVGMHISSKTESSPQWIWTTFEHVDNLEVNLLDEINGKPLRPSFNNPDCEICPINVLPDTTQTVIKNQIQRIVPISGATKELNANVQALLRDAGSKLQYYQQIGTQWPTDPSSKPYVLNSGTLDTIYTLPEAVTNKSGGMPTPLYLTNMIMETYFQGGSITDTNNAVVQTFLHRDDASQELNPVYTDTLQSYDIFLANEPAYFQMNNFPMMYDQQNTQQLIYGTESCTGCHFSSSIATDYTIVDGVKKPTFGLPASADFSWLLNQKAHFKSN